MSPSSVRSAEKEWPLEPRNALCARPICQAFRAESAVLCRLMIISTTSCRPWNSLSTGTSARNAAWNCREARAGARGVAYRWSSGQRDCPSQLARNRRQRPKKSRPLPRSPFLPHLSQSRVQNLSLNLRLNPSPNLLPRQRFPSRRSQRLFHRFPPKSLRLHRSRRSPRSRLLAASPPMG